MTLQEFIRKHDSKGLVANWFDTMRSEICMIACAHGADLERHLRKANACYHSISGYINASYSFGLISFEESTALIEELLALFEGLV